VNSQSGPGAAGNSATDLIEGDAASFTPQFAARKWQRVLRALLDGPKTTRQLEGPPTFDHCGHSTASELRKMGVELQTDLVEIVGYAGLPARVARYSLTDAGRARALQILARP
jgi:hypothetical protein